MTSSVIGAHWANHPLLAYFMAKPIDLKIELKFERWDPAHDKIEPVDGKFVRVVKTNANGTTETLTAVQSGATAATDLKKKTDSAGRVTFEGTVLIGPGGMTVHFEVDGVASGTWSTAGWKARDNLVDGKMVGFTGNPLGTASAPVTFLVGVPCWLNLRYDRYDGDPAPARFPVGTRIKIVQLSGGSQVDVHDFRVDATSEVKVVLGRVSPGAALWMLIFMRFVRLPTETGLVMNPFAITTGDASTQDEGEAGDIPAGGPAKGYLYYDGSTAPDPVATAPAGPAGYAFNLMGYGNTLKSSLAWIDAPDMRSMCTTDALGQPAGPLDVKVTMPADFGKNSLPAADKKHRIYLCLTLHAATMVREFHWLLSALIVDPKWHGLNIDSNKFETVLSLEPTDGPETMPVITSQGLRGRVMFPLDLLWNPAAFRIGADSELRSLTFQNVLFHELAHCLMYAYSFNANRDEALSSDHLFNRFIDYTVRKNRVVPFWEGWAVYYSILLLGAESFLRSQVARIAALDTNLNLGAALALAKNRTSADLDNIFTTGIINSYQVSDAAGIIQAKATLTEVLNDTGVKAAGVNAGRTSEMCLALALFSLTRLLVERQKVLLTGPVASDGTGNIPITGTEWYRNPTVMADLWTSIFNPFWRLNGLRADTVRKFTGFIADAVKSDGDWHKILKIFNTYYLLVEPPQVGSINPSTLTAGANPQVLTITGMRFPAEGTDKDGGLRVEIVPPSATQGGLSVTNSTEVKLTATFPTAGSYTLKFLGRWDPPVTKTVTVN